jgi:hypothetical protein
VANSTYAKRACLGSLIGDMQITDVSVSAILQFFKALEFNEFFDFQK